MEATFDLQTIAQQLAQQGQLIQQLLNQQNPQPMASHEPLHDLPIRPSYDWQPDALLYERIHSLANPIFHQNLSDEDRKAIIEKYPAIQGIKYTPPATLPEAQRKFNKGQYREDTSLRNIQYAASAILRPFDVLCHALVPMVTEAQADRVYAIANDTRTLILHLCGTINDARNALALRAINPAFHIPGERDTDYTMEPTKFQETLAHNTNVQKTIREATQRKSRQVFGRDSSHGGGESPASPSSLPFTRRQPGSSQHQHQRPHNSSHNSNYRSQNRANTSNPKSASLR